MYKIDDKGQKMLGAPSGNTEWQPRKREKREEHDPEKEACNRSSHSHFDRKETRIFFFPVSIVIENVTFPPLSPKNPTVSVSKLKSKKIRYTFVCSTHDVI